MVRLLKEKKPEGFRAIKGQIVGPITLAGTLRGKDEIPILHNPTLFDTVVKLLAMKARWQIETYAAFNVPKIIFLDEPYLSSYGSAFASLKKEQVVDSLNEIFEAIHQGGALAGIHCCGNTDWPMLMETQVDILNFDAFGYMDAILIYKHEIGSFLERGGYLAWGIVPTTDSINEATVNGLFDTLASAVDQLVDKGIERGLIIDNSLITPSCGTGSLSIGEAEKSMNMTHDLSMMIRERFGIS